MPSMLAGLRLATVTTVGLVTVTAVLGAGGFGRLIYDGLYNFFRTPVTVGTVCTVALAVTLDVAIILLGRALMPWSRARRKA